MMVMMTMIDSCGVRCMMMMCPAEKAQPCCREAAAVPPALPLVCPECPELQMCPATLGTPVEDAWSLWNILLLAAAAPGIAELLRAGVAQTIVSLLAGLEILLGQSPPKRRPRRLVQTPTRTMGQ